MSWKEGEYRSADDLRREIADLRLQLAFQEEFEEEVEQIRKECENPDPEILRMVREAEPGWLEVIEKNIKKRKAPKKKTVKHGAGKVAAIILVLMAVSISSALAAIQLVRAGVFKLEMKSELQYTYIYMVQSDEVAVPDGWKGDYYPAYIPEGFERDNSYSVEDCVMYFDENGNRITFYEKKHGMGTNVDTENAKISSTFINGIKAMVVEKDDVCTVVWTIEDHYFVVSGIIEKETAVRIAASVIKIHQ